MTALLRWTDIPIGPAGVVGRFLLRTRMETPSEMWRREMNAWHPQAMDNRGRRKPR